MIHTMKKKFVAWVLLVTMLFTIMPVQPMVAFADTSTNTNTLSVELDTPQWVTKDSTFKFPNATIGGNSSTPINSLTVSVSSGSMTTTGETLSDINNRTKTWTNESNTSFDPQTILRGITFNYNESMTVTVTVNSNTTSLPNGAKLTYAGDHYYMYVTETVAWSTAYNKAKQYSFNGMRGYLATITTAAEAGYLNGISESGAWTGGTSLKMGNSQIGDIVEIPSNASWTGGTTANSTKSNYYWACGPEAGSDLSGTGIPWGNGEPNSYQTNSNATNYANLVPRNNSDYETCVQANYENKATLNDVPEANIQQDGYKISGYFVEFGGYDTNNANGFVNGYDASLVATDTATISADRSFTATITLPEVTGAGWTVSNNVTLTDGSDNEKIAELTPGTAYTLTLIPTASNSGFTKVPDFTGLDADDKVVLNADGTVSIQIESASTRKIGVDSSTIKIEEGYTVTFNSNGGNEVTSGFVVSGSTVNEPAAPERTGYAFDGWALSGAVERYNFAQPVIGEITLNAIWVSAADTYPWGVANSSSSITLTTDVVGKNYVWQKSTSPDFEEGTITNLNDSDNSYTGTPSANYWYRCVIDGTPTKAVQAVSSVGSRASGPYYFSNGSMAYSVWKGTNGWLFDVAGKYSEKWINSSYRGAWNIGGTNSPSATNTVSNDNLEYIKVTFDKDNAYNLDFAVKLKEKMTAMAFGTDTMINGIDSCPLMKVRDNQTEEVRQIQMVSASGISSIQESDAALVIRPETTASYSWVGSYGNFDSGKAYADSSKDSVTGVDSSMAVSWTNRAPGSEIRFSAALGTVANTEASTEMEISDPRTPLYDGLGSNVNGSTTIESLTADGNDDGDDNTAELEEFKQQLTDNVVDLLGDEVDVDGTNKNEGYSDEELSRIALMGINNAINTLLDEYDELSDEGKREVASQIVDSILEGLNEGATLQDFADNLLADIANDENSDLARYAEAMLKVEKSSPTIGSVTNVVTGENNYPTLDITMGTGENAITPDTVTVQYLDKDGNPQTLTGAYNNGQFVATAALPNDATGIRVTTNVDGFEVVTDTALTKSTVTAGYSTVDGAANPNESGALDSTTTVNTNEAALDGAGESYTKWVPTGVTYNTNGDKDDTTTDEKENIATGNVVEEQKIKLTAAPKAGVYSDFYVGEKKLADLTAEELRNLLGDSAEFSYDSATGLQTLTYKASEAAAKNAKEITTKTRDLIGEINADTNGETIKSILNNDADNFAAVFDRGIGTNDVSGTTAWEAWDELTDAEKTAAAEMLSNEISEGTTAENGYTVSEFNAALKAAAEYVNGLEALKAVLNIDEETGLPVKDENGNYVRKPGVTAGSYDEAAKVYEAVVTAYVAATDGEKTIETDALQTLADKLAKAEAQLVESTSGVQISGAGLPDGVTVTATATFPEDVEGSAKTVDVTNEQNGYVFPKYNTDVTVSIPVKPSADTEENYNVVVTVDGEALTNEVGTLVREDQAYKLTLTGVKDPMDVSIDYVRKDVTATNLPAIITGITDANGKTVDITDEDGTRSAEIAEAAGTNVTLTLAVPTDEDGNATGSVLPGATVEINGETYPVVTDSNGNVTVAVPANVLANVDSGALAEALSKAFTADNEKLAGLIGLAEAVIADEKEYDITNDINNAYTEDSWNDLKAAYDAVAEAGEGATAAQIAALEDAYNALVPQYAVNIPNGLNIALKAVEVADPENEGETMTVYVPVQDGVVIAAATGDDGQKVTKVFVAEGTSLQLTTEPDKGESVDQITYKMDKNGDGDTEDSVDQTSTAYPAGGIITIPKVTGTVTIANPQTSANGFAVENGPLGNATGKAETVGDGEEATDTYTITPGEGSEVTSVTVDGTTVALPNAEELKAIVEAANAADAEWTGTTSKSYTVDDVNGKDVTFTKDTAQDEDGAIIATLPGIGKVSVVKDTDTGMITATVLTAGTDNLPVGTEIVLNGEVSGTGADKSVTLTDEVIRPADAAGNTTDTEIVVLQNGSDGAGNADGDAVVINFGDTNTGSHGVSATTTLKTYDLTVGDGSDDSDANTAAIKINGKTSDTVKHGSAVTVTIAAPASDDEENAGKEVSMDTVLSGTFNGEVLENGTTLADLADLPGVEVTINKDGSAAITVAEAAGAFAITAAEVEYADKDTNANANTLAGNKAAVQALADELRTLLKEANNVKANDGALYDTASDAWNALYEDDVDEATEGTQTLLAEDTAFNETLQNALSTITAASNDAALLDALNAVLGVNDTDDAYTSVAAAIDALEAINNTLETAVNAAKADLADGVVTVPTAATVEGKGVDNAATGEAITVAPTAGLIHPNATSGADLTIGNIDMADGYLPKVTFTMDNGDVKTFVVKEETDGSYSAYAVDEEGTAADTATAGITVVKQSDDTFDITIANNELAEVLGDGTTMGNIESITVSGEKQGIILPSASALQAGMQTGSTNAVNGEITMSGGTEKGNAYVVPVAGTATLTIPLSQDDYRGASTSSALQMTWYKEVVGVEINGTLYEVQSDGTLQDADGNTLVGVTVKTDKSGTTATITLDTNAEGFDAELPYETLQIVAQPTNSQYRTFKSEFEDIKALVTDPKGTEDATKAQLEDAIKSVEKLIAEAKGILPAPYALTQQNKDYLMDEIAQLDAYKDKLEAMYNAAKVEADIETLYDAVNDIIPLDEPITEDDKATLAAMEEAIVNMQNAYNDLTGYEQSLVSAEAKAMLDTMQDALRQAQQDGMTAAEQFRAVVSDIAKAVGENGKGINGGNADLIDAMIAAAEDLYIAMDDSNKTASATAKATLDGLKDKLNDYAEQAAKNFAKKYLTTDNTGAEEFTGSNRIDSNTKAADYADRLLEAKQAYDNLSAVERAAVDNLFNDPTVPQLYKDTFEVQGATLLTDDQIANNFVQKYLSINGEVITEATDKNSGKILAAKDAYDALTDDQKALVTKALTKANNGKDLSYPDLLQDAQMAGAMGSSGDLLHSMTDDDIDALGLSAAQTQAMKDARDFIKRHLMEDGSVIIAATDDNYSTILAANSPYNRLSDLAKAAVNNALTGTYKGQTYPALLGDAQATYNRLHPSSGSGFSGKYNYPVRVNDVAGGKVDLSEEYVVAGDTVTITVTPDPGKAVSSVIVIGPDGQMIPVTQVSANVFTFTMPAGEVKISIIMGNANDDVKIVLMIGSYVVYVNGDKLINDVVPVIVNDRTMLPIRIIAENLGADVDWNADLRKVIISKGGTTIEIYIDEYIAYINGDPVQLDAAAFIENDRTYLQVRFISETLGCKVGWDGMTQTVTIEGKR